MSQYDAITLRQSHSTVSRAMQEWIDEYEDAILRVEQFGQDLVVLLDLDVLARRNDSLDGDVVASLLEDLPRESVAVDYVPHVQTNDTSDSGYGWVYEYEDEPRLVDEFEGEPGACALDVREYVRDTFGVEAYTANEVFMGRGWSSDSDLESDR